MQTQPENTTLETPTNEQNRIISRQLARELSAEEVEAVSGGTTSCSGGRGDDCDTLPN